MNCEIRPGATSGTVIAPSSKSMMQRTVAAAMLANGTSEINNASFCDDANAALAISEALGAVVEISADKVRITGCGMPDPKKSELNCGEAGLSMRMFTPIAALSNRSITITGRDSLLTRPAGMAEMPLRQLGCKCETSNGKLPMKIQGPLQGGKVTVDGSITSQFLSGLLMALPLCEKDSVIDVHELKSRQYIQMTLAVIKHFGVVITSNTSMSQFTIKGRQNYKPAKYSIEGDWSGAAFMLVAGAISGKAKVDRLHKSSQPDQKILDVLKAAGASVQVQENSITAEQAELRAFDFDATDCPDLFPSLVALASNCKGKSRIAGVERLRHKESDRAAVLVEEFTKLGAKISIAGNSMEITGKKLKGGAVDSHNDHRIAMACAVAALNSENGVSISNAECVSKSYPSFFKDLEGLGARVKQEAG